MPVVQARQDAAKRPDVDRSGVAGVGEDLGRGEEWRANCGHRHHVITLAAHTEVGHFGCHCLGHEDVLGLQVAVDDAHPVQIRHGACDAECDGHTLLTHLGLVGPVAQHCAERSVDGELHDDADDAAFDVPRAANHLNHVGVAQRQVQLDLVLEVGERLLRQSMWAELLDCARGALVKAAAHGAERALADLSRNLQLCDIDA